MQFYIVTGVRFLEMASAMHMTQKSHSLWEVLTVNTLMTGHLNCLNARSRGLNNLNQFLYCVSLKICNKFANYFCELKVSGNTHQRP